MRDGTPVFEQQHRAILQIGITVERDGAVGTFVGHYPEALARGIGRAQLNFFELAVMRQAVKCLRQFATTRISDYPVQMQHGGSIHNLRAE